MDEKFTIVDGAENAAREMMKRLLRDGYFCVEIVMKPSASLVEMPTRIIAAVRKNLGGEWFVAARVRRSERVSDHGQYTRFEVWAEKLNKHEDN